MLIGTGWDNRSWMQFYLQASVVDKGWRQRPWGRAFRCHCRLNRGERIGLLHYPRLRPPLFKAGIKVRFAEQAALALRPLAGSYCTWLFAFSLFTASMFAAAVLPLSTHIRFASLRLGVIWIRSFLGPPVLPLLFYDLFSGLVILTPTYPLFRSCSFLRLSTAWCYRGLIFMVLLVNDRSVMKGTHQRFLFESCVMGNCHHSRWIEHCYGIFRIMEDLIKPT
jgi:Mn2+/Fe2+ NRAMP family transporter